MTAAAAEGRWRANYARYFDDGWLDAVRLALAAAFVGALWLLLYLGAQLFKLIGVDAVRDLISKEWFAFPITAVFVGLGLHLTDVRSQMVAGARTLILTLLSWLLPVLTVFATAFLLTAPFTGLEALWGTRSATGTMLAVCGALIILINAAYQDGAQTPPLALRWSVRLAGVVIAPLVVIAGWGLAMRIGQYGLTPARVAAAVILVVTAVYAVGYLAAVAPRGPWMKRLEPTNWICAHLVVAAVLLVFSPLLDPARLAVDDQVGRLERGAVKPAAFDFQFLRFDAGRWGQGALARLAKSADPAIAQGAKDAIAQKTKIYSALTEMLPENSIHASTNVPQSFLTQTWPADQDPRLQCMKAVDGGCEAIVGDIDGVVGLDVLVFPVFGEPRVYGMDGGRWKLMGSLLGHLCPEDRHAVRDGRWRIGPARPTFEIDGRPFAFQPPRSCEGQGDGPRGRRFIRADKIPGAR